MSKTTRTSRSETWHRSCEPKGFYDVIYAYPAPLNRYVSLDPIQDRKRIREIEWQNTKESQANERSPGHWYRLNRHKQLRQSARKEIFKFIMLGDYEPMILSDPISCLWDWR